MKHHDIQTHVFIFSTYRNVPKFSDRQVWANSADPDLTAPRRSSLIRVYTVCNSGCTFWMHYSKEKSSCSIFRVITANFLGVRNFFGFLRYTFFKHCCGIQYAMGVIWRQRHISIVTTVLISKCRFNERWSIFKYCCFYVEHEFILCIIVLLLNDYLYYGQFHY